MAKISHRISYELLDDDLKSIINSNINVRPLPLSDIQNNINPNNYEYVRPVEREYNNYLYRWDEDHFEMLGGESVHVTWDNIMNKPSEYPPAEHTHTDLHVHSNKSILDIITQTLIDTWNTVTGKADKVHSHDDLYYTEGEVDSKLASKSDVDHNHDGRYYTKSEADSKIGQKAALVHTHSKADITDFSHTHSKADIIDMPSIPTDTSHLSKSDVYTKDEIDNMMVEVGAGDMLKAFYDYNGDGKVNVADYADSTHWNGIEGKPDFYPPAEHSHNELHEHSNMSILNAIEEAFTTALKEKLDSLNNYVHPTGDGNLHVPPTGTTNNNKVLKAGSTEGSIAWGTITPAEIGAASITHLHTKAQITDFPTIPNAVSQLTNDKGFVSITLGTVKPSDGFWFREVI